MTTVNGDVSASVTRQSGPGASRRVLIFSVKPVSDVRTFVIDAVKPPDDCQPAV